MKKVVIVGSVKLQNDINYWKQKFGYVKSLVE